MPPKKGKKGKKGKKELKTITNEAGEVIDENSRQFYLIQIKDLEDKLKRYQKKSDEMEVMCKKYETQYESSNTEKRDIVANLKKELDKRSDDILDLNDRLVGLQQAKEAEKDTFEKQLADLRTEFQETKDILTNQNNALMAKLTSLEEFKSQKEELLTKLENLQQHIDYLELDHKNKLNEIEKKGIIDKDRLKKEMVVKVSQVAAEFRRVSNKQMADTTKRTIKENVSVSTQLQKMSEKVIDMIEENDSSKLKEKINKQQIDLLEDNEKELCRKNVSNLKVIRLLTEKCRSQEAIIIDLEEKLNETKENEANQEQLIADLEKELKDTTDAVDENGVLSKKINKLQDELVSTIKYRNKVERVLKQATDALVIALSKNAVNQKHKVTDENGFEWSNIEKRDNLLENMLILLNSAAAIGMGPNPEVFGSNYVQRPRTSEYPGSGKGIRRHHLPDEEDRVERKFHAHYELGDLGIVPRQDEHIMTNYEKKLKLKPTKELNSLQKLTKKTVATQTIDHVKASLFGIDDEYMKRDKIHPIYSEMQQSAAGAATNQHKANTSSNPQYLMPLNDQHRSYKVTNNVF